MAASYCRGVPSLGRQDGLRLLMSSAESEAHMACRGLNIQIDGHMSHFIVIPRAHSFTDAPFIRYIWEICAKSTCFPWGI